jgi:hypothetical protein
MHQQVLAFDNFDLDLAPIKCLSQSHKQIFDQKYKQFTEAKSNMTNLLSFYLKLDLKNKLEDLEIYLQKFHISL